LGGRAFAGVSARERPDRHHVIQLPDYSSGARDRRLAVPLILAACFIGVFCLAPLAVYLLWLAAVHRRGQPVPISGGGDLTALLIGLSGFILAGAVVTLTAVQ